VRVCVRARACVRVRMCVCVFVEERERERERAGGFSLRTLCLLEFKDSVLIGGE